MSMDASMPSSTVASKVSSYEKLYKAADALAHLLNISASMNDIHFKLRLSGARLKQLFPQNPTEQAEATKTLEALTQQFEEHDANDGYHTPRYFGM